MQPYLQTTDFTTAASSLLSILHYFDPEIALTKENEFNIWQKTANLPTRGSSIFALANYAQEQGLNPIVIVEEKSYNFPDYRFYRYKKSDIEQAEFSDQLHLKKAQQKGIKIEEREITLTEIKSLLSTQKIILLRLNAGHLRGKRNTSNYLVIYGYKNNHFQIIDPQTGSFSISEQIIRDAFDSLESKKFRDHRMIIF